MAINAPLLLKRLFLISVTIFGLLTVVVLFFCADARIHPHEKGISLVDIIDYCYISLGLLFLALVFKVLSIALYKRNKAKNLSNY